MPAVKPVTESVNTFPALSADAAVQVAVWLLVVAVSEWLPSANELVAMLNAPAESAVPVPTHDWHPAE